MLSEIIFVTAARTWPHISNKKVGSPTVGE